MFDFDDVWEQTKKKNSIHLRGQASPFEAPRYRRKRVSGASENNFSVTSEGGGKFAVLCNEPFVVSAISTRKGSESTKVMWLWFLKGSSFDCEKYIKGKTFSASLATLFSGLAVRGPPTPCAAGLIEVVEISNCRVLCVIMCKVSITEQHTRAEAAL